MKTTSLTEEDTVKRLKGLTNEEAFNVFCEVYDSISTEWINAPGTSHLPTHILRDKVDEALKPYGWSFDMVLKLNAFEGNIS